jgi:class 3 adenylate cyclase/tetratricopeptide (TPR) repeat protein
VIAGGFGSYVPELVSRRFATNPVLLQHPEAEALSAALLFVDISGFTPLAEQLAKQGPIGAEKLSQILNDYFRSLISCITDHGGDIVKFAGDAMLAIWLDEGEGLGLAISQASQCALEIQENLGRYKSLNGSRLLLHIGISAGLVVGMHVGGYRDRWHYVITGEPLKQLSLAIHEAKQGDIVLSSDAWKLISSRSIGIPMGNGCFKVQSILDTPIRRASVFVQLKQDAETVLRAYISDFLLSIKITPWLAELRRITTLFVNFPDLDHSSSDALQNLQSRMLMLQEIITKYEGCIKDLIVDDKGPTLVVLYGTPLLAHEDDPIRSIRTALEIRSKFSGKEIQSNIGIATGRCFCGIIGGEMRKEYAVIGEVMNVAARLMQSGSNNGIFCDEETFQIAKTRFAFEHKSLTVKGKADSISAHIPLSETESSRHLVRIIGRVNERKQLSLCLDNLLKGESGVIILEGEPGIGKSRLSLEVLYHASNRGIRCFVGSGDAIERSTPYYAWRPIYNDLFDIEKVVGPDERKRILIERLGSEPNQLSLFPLLSSVLSLDLPENEVTRNMPIRTRAEATRDFLTSLFQISLKKERLPILIVLEDAHWMDASSLALAQEISKRIRPSLLLIVTRPLNENFPSDSGDWIQMKDAVRVHLEGLSVEETSEIIKECLGLKDLEHSVTELIHERAGGNAFFAQEIAYALRDSGLIVIRDGKCSLAPSLTDPRFANFPNTLEGVVTSRIDRLPPAHQLTLKVASVIGREFEVRILEDIHPERVERSSVRPLSEDLENLERVDLIRKENLEPYLTYLFKHALTQDVAYNLLLFSQRRLLHRAVAEFCERTQAGDLPPIYPLLSYHWGKAEVESKALFYTEKAGEESLRNGALREAISFYSDAMKILDRTKSEDETTRRGHYEYQLGQAFYALANWAETRNHLGKALTIMYQAPPKSTRELRLSILREVLFQFAHRLLSGMFIGRSSDDHDLLKASRAYERISEMSIFQNDSEVLIHSMLKSLNLAEKAGTAADLARVYAGVALIVGTIPMHRLARRYRSLARKVAERVEDFPSLAFLGQTLGLYETGVAEWEEASADLRRSIEVSEKATDWDRWEECASAFGASLYLQSRFSESIQWFNKAVTSARRRGNLVHQGWGVSGHGENLFRIGETGEAIKFLEESLSFFNEKEDRVFQIGVRGLLAMAHMRLGAGERARKEAKKTLSYIVKSRPTLITQLEGYAGAAEVFLALWESGTLFADMEPNYFAEKARVACNALWSFARVFPVAEPRALLCEGWAHRLGNSLRDAQRDWERGLISARRLRMPYEEGRLYCEIGRFLDADNPDRTKHLTQATKIFSEIGVSYDLEFVKTCLG